MRGNGEQCENKFSHARFVLAHKLVMRREHAQEWRIVWT